MSSTSQNDDLRAHVDDDGLVPATDLGGEGPEYSMRGVEQRVRVVPEALGVARYLRSNARLWAAAKLHVTTRWTEIKRALVFGVPFSKGLQACLAGGSPVRAVFQRPDWEALTPYGVIATMTARFVLDGGLRTFEAWQVIAADSVTHYVHALFPRAEAYATHIDGATIEHSVEEMKELERGRKAWGSNKVKHWRLDGRIELAEVGALFDSFMPLDDLTAEFFAGQASRPAVARPARSPQRSPRDPRST